MDSWGHKMISAIEVIHPFVCLVYMVKSWKMFENSKRLVIFVSNWKRRELFCDMFYYFLFFHGVQFFGDG